MLNISGTGKIAKDAELGVTPSGAQFAKFSVYSKVGFNKDDDDLLVLCRLWGNQATALHKYLIKGRKVTFSGSANVFSFDDGKTCMTCSIHAIDPFCGDPKPSHSDEPQRASDSQPKYSSEDIPF